MKPRGLLHVEIEPVFLDSFGHVADVERAQFARFLAIEFMTGDAAEMRNNPDVQEFYLGSGHSVDYQAVKHYRRRKRWLT